MYEPLARPLYDVPDCDPFAPKATGGSHAPEAEVGPASVQVSVRVAFRLLVVRERERDRVRRQRRPLRRRRRDERDCRRDPPRQMPCARPSIATGRDSDGGAHRVARPATRPRRSAPSPAHRDNGLLRIDSPRLHRSSRGRPVSERRRQAGLRQRHRRNVISVENVSPSPTTRRPIRASEQRQKPHDAALQAGESVGAEGGTSPRVQRRAKAGGARGNRLSRGGARSTFGRGGDDGSIGGGGCEGIRRLRPFSKARGSFARGA